MITLEQAEKLEKEAKENNGRCTNCHHSINIYRYPVNKVMVKFLRAMAKATDDTGSREIDVEKVSVIHHERTQITKLRIHGLIAKVKDEKGHHKARHWLITKKGWDFLRGDPIPRYVIIYNNQVLGHGDQLTTIDRIDNASQDYEQKAISEPEAKVYADVRTEPIRKTTYHATYLNMSSGDLLKGSEYVVHLERLAMGKPVVIDIEVQHRKDPIHHEYKDIAAFQRNWQIGKKVEAE